MQLDRDREFKIEESGQKRRETRYRQSKRLRQDRHGGGKKDKPKQKDVRGKRIAKVSQWRAPGMKKTG